MHAIAFASSMMMEMCCCGAVVTHYDRWWCRADVTVLFEKVLRSKREIDATTEAFIHCS